MTNNRNNLDGNLSLEESSLDSASLVDFAHPNIRPVSNKLPIFNSISTSVGSKSINNKNKLISELLVKITNETKEDVLAYFQKTCCPLYGGISNEEGALLFLHWLCYYLSYQKMQVEFEYPHSNYESSFATLRGYLLHWALQQIGVPNQTYQDRLEIALSCVSFESFVDCTLILDSIHLPIMNTKSQKSQKNYSLKLGRTARSYQIAITQDKIIAWISKAYEGSRQNLDCMYHSIQSFKSKVYTPQDVVLVDPTYKGLEQCDVHIATPSRKRKHPDSLIANVEGGTSILEEDMVDGHKQLYSKINDVFTALKSKFAILSQVFRGPSQRQEEIFIICCALYNNDLRAKLGWTRNF